MFLSSAYHRGRSVGLSKKQRVQPLLTIPGRENKVKPEEIVNKQLNKITMVDPNDSDPPMSVSSGDEASSRADIRPTKFESANKSAASSQASTRPKRQAAKGQTRTTRASQVESISSSQPSSSAEGNRESLSQESKNSRKRKSPETAKPPKKTVSTSFNMFGGISRVQPVVRNTYSRRKVIEPTEEIEDDDIEDESPKKPVTKPRDVLAKKDAPTSSPKKPMVIPKDFSRKDASSSPKKEFSLPRDFLEKKALSVSPQREFRPPPPEDPYPLKRSPERKRLKKSLGQEKPKVESPEPDRPGIIIPDFYSENFKEKDEDDVLEAEENAFKEDSSLGITGTDQVSIIDPARSSKVVCGLCEEEVDENIRKTFDKKHPSTRFSLRREQLFCLFHKRRSARKTWKLKGYPEIDWEKLDKRIAKQHEFLQAILEGGQSYYGDIFNQSVKSGQNRTLLKSDQNMTPGYYGIRGLRVMTENLTYKFSRLLRERAVQDRLISSRGYMAYLQSVLVPELAVRLIKDDMSVSEEEAREIMEESSAVGELLNEELKDVVLESEDDK